MYCVSFCLSPIIHLKVALKAQNYGCLLIFDLIEVAFKVQMITKLQHWNNNMK